MKERKRTISEEQAYLQLTIALHEQELWLKNFKLSQAFIPAEWYRIERDVPVRKRKTKLTAAFDADLVKWFRGMGLGYQARMNAVLRTFMLAMISKEIPSEKDFDWKGDPL